MKKLQTSNEELKKEAIAFQKENGSLQNKISEMTFSHENASSRHER